MRGPYTRCDGKAAGRQRGRRPRSSRGGPRRQVSVNGHEFYPAAWLLISARTLDGIQRCFGTRTSAAFAMLAHEKSGRAIRPHVAHGSQFRAVESRVLAHLRRGGFDQSEFMPCQQVDALRVAQRRDFQFERPVQRQGLFLPGAEFLELKTQVNAAEVLVDVQHAANGNDGAERCRLVEIAHFERFDVAHQARIVDALHRVKLHHRRLVLSHHGHTFSAHRSFALRDLGFAACSSGRGTITCLVSTFSVPALSASWNACFTGRSSREWYVNNTQRPPEFKVAGVRERNCPSSSNSRFTAIRSARNVFVAGCSFCLPHCFRTPATTVARCAVSRMGRARTMALAILLESCSSASR